MLNGFVHRLIDTSSGEEGAGENEVGANEVGIVN